MTPHAPDTARILAIAPSSRGFGYAVLETNGTLADWGVKSVNGHKNIRSLTKAEDLMDHYRPSIVILEDHNAHDARRAPRIHSLHEAIVAVAQIRNVQVAFLTRAEVLRGLFPDGQGTKYLLAKVLAERFPAELACRLPPKRRPWTGEDYRMGIFDAVALVHHFLVRQKLA